MKMSGRKRPTHAKPPAPPKPGGHTVRSLGFDGWNDVGFDKTRAGGIMLPDSKVLRVRRKFWVVSLHEVDSIDKKCPLPT